MYIVLEGTVLNIDIRIGYNSAEPVADIRNFQLLPGSFTYILGTNGTGKSTFFRTLIGDLAPLSGHLDNSIIHSTAIVSDYLGIPTGARLIDLFKLLSDTRFELAKKQFSVIYKTISPLKQRHIEQLSSGQRYIAEIFLMLAAGRNIIIMDEACSALDFANKSAVFEALDSIVKQGGIVLYTSHDLEDITFTDGLIFYFSQNRLIPYSGQRDVGSVRHAIVGGAMPC